MIDQDQPGEVADPVPDGTVLDDSADDPVGGSVLDLVGPALDRASALADELARLLVPARLFS